MNADADITERFPEIAGMRTRVLEVTGAGPPILLLHGFADSADSWRPVLAELARRSRRAVAVDMPGSGQASPLGRPPLACLDRFADGFVNAYGDGNDVVLAGNSLGGLVALRAAARPGLPLAAVAGLGPAGLAYTAHLDSVTRLAARLDPVLRVAERFPVPTALVRAAARAEFNHRLARGRAEASLADRFASHLHGMRDLARRRADLIALSADETILDRAVLETIQVPVLLVWGDSDHLADVTGASVLLDVVPRSRLVMLVDCGHCPQLEVPAEVASMLASLPASLRPGAVDEGADVPQEGTLP
jgi:pimeloyl-ACP methyl ester carboxylesterase